MIKEQLNTLKTNIQNAKNKLYSNLTDKGVTTITTASTLDAMADSVSGITTSGGSEGGNLSFVFENNIRINDYTEWLNYVDISKLTSISNMFSGVKYKTLDLRSWDVSKIRNLAYTFNQSSGLTSIDVSNWNTSAVADMQYTFSECKSLTSLDVSNWDTSSVTNMNCMFNECRKLTSLDVSNWNTSAVTNMKSTFNKCSGLTSLDVSNWNTSAVTDMQYMFYGCNKLTSLDVSNWNTSAVTDMQYMFGECNKLTSLDVSSFDTSNVTNMKEMFVKCSGLTSLDVSNWNTSAVTNMNGMFGYFSISSLDLSNWNTSAVTNMQYMFKFSDFKSINLSGWDFNTSPLYMFYNCSSLESVDFSNCITNKITSYDYIFNDCSSLEIVDGYLSLMSVNRNIDKTIMFGWSTQNNLRKIAFKDLGYNNNFTSIDMSYLNVWGVNSDTITDARQSLIDSLITYSYDRATAGYSTCTVTLSTNTKAVLTDDEIAAITAKGFTIA